MMVATGMPIQEQALDYSFLGNLPHSDALIDPAKERLWNSMESIAISHPYGTESRTAHASPTSSHSPSPKPQGSLQCYPSRVSEPVQPADFMGHSYGRYCGPYSSRASSTLPSPSPMTPNTDDMSDQWTGRRRPSDFATSAVPSLFSPKSPSDYDFPTGTHLPPLMNGSQEPPPHAADLLPEGFEIHQAGCYFDPGPVTWDAKSSCIPMSGPPYPPHILDHNGDIFPEPYLDPRGLHLGMADETYTTPEDLLNMDYSAEFQVPVPQGLPQNALEPIQEDDYVNTEEHVNVYAGRSPREEAQQTPLLTTGIQPPEPSHQQGVHGPEYTQRSLDRHPSNQVRSTPMANNQCTTCNKAHDSQTKLRKHIRKEHVRPYPCIFTHYGCNSVFGTKNEWSRHVKVQHLRLATWKCNIDECEKLTATEDRLLLPSASKGKCEYDRKDLFLNHVRRCHKDQYPQPGTIEGTRAMAYEDHVQQTCHLALRAPPSQTLCPCCPGTLWTDFDARLEHIGRTMEANEDARASFHDPNLEVYMLNEGLLQWGDTVGWLLTGAEGKKGGRQARRGSLPKPLTTHAPLSGASAGYDNDDGADEQNMAPAQPSRKSKRVELKRKKQLQLRQGRTAQEQQQPEENSDEDAEADDDEEYHLGTR